MSIQIKPTYIDPNANTMIFEFDASFEDVSNWDNQITADNAYGEGNKYTPFLLHKIVKDVPKGETVHVKIVYKATEFDTNGNVTAIKYTYYVNDNKPVTNTTVHGSLLSKIPAPSDITKIRLDLNNSFIGDAYFDNFKVAIVHEHEYHGGKCECGEVDPSYTAFPEIWSKNVEYGSKTYLRYAVPVASIPASDRVEGGVWLEVCEADGTVVFEKLFPEAETQTVNGKECYVFKSRGVPAKELNTQERVQVKTASGAESDFTYYSVEEYLYTKLYAERYATETSEGVSGVGMDDGKDYLRRTLYYDLLKYGAIAQELLSTSYTDKIGDTTYAKAPGAVATLGKLNAETKIKLVYDYNVKADGTFIAWKFTEYDFEGNVVNSGYATDGSIFYVNGYFYAEPAYDYVEVDPITFDDDTYLGYYTPTLGNISSTTATEEKKWYYRNESGGTASEVGTAAELYQNHKNDKFAVSSIASANGDNYLSFKKDYGTNANATNASVKFKPTAVGTNANVAIFETDITYVGSSVDLYISLGRDGLDTSTNGIYYAYLNLSGGVIQIAQEYSYESGSRTNVFGIEGSGKSPAKLTGATANKEFNLRIEYWEAEKLEDAKIRMYVNDTFVYETNTIAGKNWYQKGTAPQAEDATSFQINIGNSALAELRVDDLAYAIKELPEAELYGADATVTDFDYSDAATLSASGTNSYEIVTDPVTGTSYVALHKSKGVSGGSITMDVTEKQAGANLMVFECDMYIVNGASVVTQVNAGHKHTGGKNGNNQTPFMPTINTTLRNQWVRIRIEYKALQVDADGNAVKVSIKIFENGVLKGSNDPEKIVSGWNITSNHAPDGNGVYTSATNIVKIPLPSEMMNLKIALNQSCDGEFRFDNLSLKLLKVEGCDPKVVSAT